MQKGVNLSLVFLCLVGFLLGTSAPTCGHFTDQPVILRTGNLRVMKVEPLVLENELILLQLDGDYVKVFARYKFKNSGGSRTITFALPVDYLHFGGAPLEELQRDLRVRDEYNTEYLVQMRDDEATTVFETRDEEYTAYRKWFTVEVPFPSRGERHLTVSYRVKTLSEDGESYFSYFPDFAKRRFQYSFEPGALNSVVEDLQLIIDTRDCPWPDAETLEVNLQEYSNYDGLISYSAEQLDLLKMPELQLQYSTRAQKSTQFVLAQRVPRECITQVRASSSYLDKYPAANLLDNNLNTAWIEGVAGDGVGEWVEVELTDFQLYSIALVNGYTKSASTYTVNSKIKKLKLEVECVDPSGCTEELVWKEYTVELARHQYGELNKEVFASFMDVLADFGDNYLIARKIRLTILEVMPGTKYSDTGISELYLLGNRVAEVDVEDGNVE